MLLKQGFLIPQLREGFKNLAKVKDWNGKKRNHQARISPTKEQATLWHLCLILSWREAIVGSK